MLLGFIFIGWIGFVNGLCCIPGDTLLLQPVEVHAPRLDQFAKGQYVISMDSAFLGDSNGQTLSELLQRRSGLFVRQYGPGMIASLTMRGTSAGHNAFFWNGLPINSPSLGQMDLSLLPVFGIDNVQIHMGSSGAQYGTDAIGGAVHLTSRIMSGTGWKIGMTTGIGSFGLDRQEFQAGYSNSRAGSRTRVYRHHARNHYPFRNLGKTGLPIEIQDHAAVHQTGFIQDLAWRVNATTQLSSSFWWNSADRQIQPVMGSNFRDVQADRSARWVLDFNRTTQHRHLNLKAGWVRDEMVFNRSDVNVTDQFLLAGELDWALGSRFEFKTGGRGTYIRGSLSTYHATDERIEIFQAINFKADPDLVVSLNLRQMMWGGEFAPFTPSLGLDWTLLRQGSHQVITKVSGARSFKVPTLNDRFWVPGGNPDLRSEDALSGELGLDYRYTDSKISLEAKVTYYDMQVSNWILWLPGDTFWSPRNVRSVSSKGMDLFFSGQRQMGVWRFGLSGAWASNQSLILGSDDFFTDEVGKTLPYTPNNKAQLGVNLQRGAFRVFLNGQWIGERYISIDNQSSLAAYQLLDTAWRYERAFGRHNISLGFHVNNVMNTSYQVLRLRPMPGRNYEVNLTYTL